MSQNAVNKQGQGLNEYTLIGVLVALILIPVLGTLGSSLNEQFFSMFSNGKGRSANVLAGGGNAAGKPSALGVSANMGGAPAANSGGVQTSQLPYTPTPIAKSGGGLSANAMSLMGNAVYRKKRGEVVIPTNGGGTQTASVEGASWAVAEQIIALLQEYVDENGQPLPENLQADLRALAEQGYKLGDMQFLTLHDYPLGRIGGGELIQYGDAYIDAHEATIQAIKDQYGEGSTDAEALISRLNTLSGTITYVNFTNYIAKAVDPRAINLQINKPQLYTIGVAPDKMPTAEETPPITMRTSYLIETADKDAVLQDISNNREAYKKYI